MVDDSIYNIYTRNNVFISRHVNNALTDGTVACSRRLLRFLSVFLLYFLCFGIAVVVGLVSLGYENV